MHRAVGLVKSRIPIKSTLQRVLRYPCTQTGSLDGDTIYMLQTSNKKFKEQVSILVDRTRRDEVELCICRTLLYLFRNDIELSHKNVEELTRQLELHKEHRREDLEEVLKNLKKQKAELEDKIELLEDIDEDTSAFMERGQYF